MAPPMNESAAPRLERSCGPLRGDWMRIAASAPGLERIEAFFAGHGYDPHRHDTYALGMTCAGVQAFRYRGAARRCRPGQLFVLHPDELHDGHAGSAGGFRYRILYVEPRLIQEALGAGGGGLPFVRDAVSHNPRLAAAMLPALAGFAGRVEELQRDQIVADLAEALAAADGSFPRRTLAGRHLRAVRLARELLDAAPQEAASSAALEAVTGVSRYALARHFRACLGTSPHRYLTMRRLERARALIRRGVPLAEAAVTAGFADQSHLTRHFRRAYGLPPGRWAALAGGRGNG